MAAGAVMLKAGIFLVTRGMFSAVICAFRVQHHMGLLETNETKNTDTVRNPVSKLNEMAINGGGEGKC